MPKQTKPDLDDRIQQLLIVLIRISLGIAIIWLAFQRDWSGFGITILALVLTSLPRFLESRFKVSFPIEFSMIIVTFVYMSTFLGEVGDAYEKLWWWDGLLHTASGIVLGFAGFLVLYVLYARDELKASPRLLAFFAFSFALAAGAFWEIFEYGADSLLGTNMQKSGLHDTMSDLIVDALGALFISRAVLRFMERGEKSIVSGLIKDFLKRNPHLRKS